MVECNREILLLLLMKDKQDNTLLLLTAYCNLCHPQPHDLTSSYLRSCTADTFKEILLASDVNLCFLKVFTLQCMFIVCLLETSLV